MTALLQAQRRAQAPGPRAPNSVGIGSNLFWMLLAPVCSLLDSRFRHYASNRDAHEETEWLSTRLQLPDAKSCTSWAARREMGGRIPPIQASGLGASDTSRSRQE